MSVEISMEVTRKVKVNHVVVFTLEEGIEEIKRQILRGEIKRLNQEDQFNLVPQDSIVQLDWDMLFEEYNRKVTELDEIFKEIKLHEQTD